MTGAHDAVLEYVDVFFINLYDHSIQEFDMRWDKVLLSMTKIPSDEILDGVYKLRIRESEKLKKRIGIVRHGDLSKTSVPNYQKLKTMVKDGKIRNLDYEIVMQARENWKQEQWLESKENHWLKEEKVSVTSGRKRPVFARRPLQFPPRDPRSCALTRTHCRHTFRASHFTRWKCDEEEKYPRQKWPWVPSSTTVETLFERWLRANAL